MLHCQFPLLTIPNRVTMARMRASFVLLAFSLSVHLVRILALHEDDMAFDGHKYGWRHGKSAKKTYLFTNMHWWESLDHQMTSIISLLALAKNTSSIAVIPFLAASKSNMPSANTSLLGDYFDIDEVNKVQSVITMQEFMKSKDYELLKKEKTGTVPFPKDSQEAYEAQLKVFGKLHDTMVYFQMPDVDPEHTNQRCNNFGGTIHVSSNGKRRYVFLDRIHFFHFCVEKFMPWWYDVRHWIAPKQRYFAAAENFLENKKRPIASIHISDLMDSQKDREDEEVERYARQIVDALRKHQAIGGSMYLIHAKKTKNVQRVVNLLNQEFADISNCSSFFSCGKEVPQDILEPSLLREEHKNAFESRLGLKMLEWALSSRTNVFIGNVHSAFSRNICLHRKTHGEKYAILKGFAELRKIWSWNL